VTYGSAELRQPLGTAKLLVRGQIGATVMADAGRVYYSGEDSNEWHSAVGAGLWFHFRIRTTPLGASATFALGEEPALYLKFGAPF
jgi:hypothetical protein